MSSKNKVVWSLFDGSGYMIKPYADLGYKCYCFNKDDSDHGDYKDVRISHPNIEFINRELFWWMTAEDFLLMNVEKPDIIFSFPPCTDIAVSGARHFERKLKENPNCQIDAVRTARLAEKTAEEFHVPYMIENPVSVMSSIWRKPDFIFHPYEFGGWIPEGQFEHPAFPQYITARDAYTKKTCLWFGNGFNEPEKNAVDLPVTLSDQYTQLGGKSNKTKMIRSLTPRGFALAVCEQNKI